MEGDSPDTVRRVPKRFWIAICLLAIAAILYAQFSQPMNHPGYVVDANNQPMRGVTLKFREPNGKEDTVVTTQEGRFWLPEMGKISYAVEGNFVLAKVRAASESGYTCTYAQSGSQEIQVHDTLGRPMPGFPLKLTPTYNLMQQAGIDFEKSPVIVKTDAHGIVQWNRVAAAERLHIEADDNRNHAIGTVNTTVRGTAVHYDATAVPGGTITGTLLDKSGTKIDRSLAWATIDPKGIQDRPTVYWMAKVNPDGHFRFANLKPGVYYIEAFSGQSDLLPKPNQSPIPAIHVEAGKSVSISFTRIR